MTTCSMPLEQAYRLPNPIFAAFNHQIDLTQLRDTIQKNTLLKVQEIDDGLILYSYGEHRNPYKYRLWINDSLLVFKLETMPFLPRPFNNTIVGKVILESTFRASYPDLVNTTKDLFSRQFHFFDRYVDDNNSYKNEDYPQRVSFLIDPQKLQAVDTLTWQSNVFGNQVSYQFKNGILHGEFQSIDSTGLMQVGFFREGLEQSIWKYYDARPTLPIPQFVETYAADGRLEKIDYEDYAIFDRPAPLPTINDLKTIHRVGLFILILLSVFVFYFFIKSLHDVDIPYKGQSALEAIGGVILSISLAFMGGVILLFLIPLITHSVGSIFNWDLPVDLLEMILPALIFIIFEFCILAFTNRLKDFPWHFLIAILFILIYFEWKLLGKLMLF